MSGFDVRLFVCAPLDDSNQAFYGDRMNRLLERHPGLLRPIPPASAHITFAFMSAIPDDDLARISIACGEATANISSFETVMSAPFVLYGGSEARLVCAPVTTGTTGLSALETRLGTALTPLYSADRVKRTKSFHVTLARFRKNLRRSSARPVDVELREASIEEWTRAQMVDHLAIVSSDLRPGGPVYTTRHVIPLRGGH